MKKSGKKRFLSLLCAGIIMICAGCSGDGGTVTGGTSDVTESGTSATAEPGTEAGAVTPDAEATTVPAGTDAPAVDLYDGRTHVIDVKWHSGYIGSAQHTSYAYLIKTGGKYYSYTDVIHIEKAGTRISFTDDNTNSGGDTDFASGNALVVSSWIKREIGYSINREGYNYAGSGKGASDIAEKVGSSVVYTYVTTLDDEYVRLSFRSGETGTFKPAKYPDVKLTWTGEKGTAVRTFENDEKFAEYVEALKKEADPASALYGKTLYAIGDSYFAGHGLDGKYVWPAILAAKYSMTFENYGKNGSAISDYDPTGYPMCRRYTEMKTGSPDLILVEGGKNDYNRNVPIGEPGSTDSGTFYGALGILISGLRSKYPSAQIICITPWKVNGTNDIGRKVKDYADAMRTFCEKEGIPVFSADDPDLSGVDMTDAAFRKKWCMADTDVSHLNVEGHQMVLPAFEKFILENFG